MSGQLGGCLRESICCGVGRTSSFRRGGGKALVAGAGWRNGSRASAELVSGACLQVEVSERYSAASESGSSTDGHPETAETKDGKTSPWERQGNWAVDPARGEGFCSFSCHLKLA